MPSSGLPEHPSLEYLKKLAKERLEELRRADPAARLAAAQLAVARDHGFPSWRALKAEVDRRTLPLVESFYAACAEGDLPALREMLAREPGLVRERLDGSTPLHRALRHPDAVRLLLEHGADPNARDEGDNALPLHFAAGGAPLESVRVLLDAGSDVQGEGDAHRLGVIGWATVFAGARTDVVDLLVERGARHHVFSAISLGDQNLLRQVVEADPAALGRRLAPTEQEQTALHYVIAPPDGLVGGLFRTGEHYGTLALLITLGADLEAKDAKGRTPLAVAMLRGDREAMRMLHGSGAREPESLRAAPAAPPDLAGSVRKLSPMVGVPDMEAAVAWYRSIGFRLAGSHMDDVKMDWASLTFGDAEIMLVPAADPRRTTLTGLSLWLRTDRLDEVYAFLKERQLERARAVLAGNEPGLPDVRFKADLHTAFYGQREFCILDPNGVELAFYQPLERSG